MQPIVQSLLEELLRRHGETRAVDLNDIMEVIGERAVAYEDVEDLIDALESRGLRVAEALVEEQVAFVREVVREARAFAQGAGRRPTVEELATRLGRPLHEVRRALEWAGRPGRMRSALPGSPTT